MRRVAVRWRPRLFAAWWFALIGIMSDGATYGTGYEQARSAIEGSPLPIWFFAEKFAASLVSMVSGIPGGIFAPSLAVGAGLGSTIGLLFGTGSGLAATLGMAGYFAGVVQAPMTAFVIILEMTGNHDKIIPLMLASLFGFGTARLVSGEALYHSLSRNFVADVLRIQRAQDSQRTNAPRVEARSGSANLPFIDAPDRSDDPFAG